MFVIYIDTYTYYVIIKKLMLIGRKQEQTHLRNTGVFKCKDSETVKGKACMPQYRVRDLLIQR